MKKLILLLSLIMTSTIINAQKPIESTNQFIIMGFVDKPKIVTFNDLEREKATEIGDLKITNHLGEFKKEYKNLKGISLLSLMKDINITASSPKLLSEYYFILKASDGYSAVISWNELFNTEIGNTFFLVVEADDKSQKDGLEKILLVSTKDFKTGRRHIKGLQSIEVKRI